MSVRQIAIAMAALGSLIAVLWGGTALATDPDGPPFVKSGTAKSNCERIVAAGYSPHDYVLKFGNWWYWPGYSGPDGARMSSIWGSVPECLAGSPGDPNGRVAVSEVQQGSSGGTDTASTPAPAN